MSISCYRLLNVNKYVYFCVYFTETCLFNKKWKSIKKKKRFDKSSKKVYNNIEKVKLAGSEKKNIYLIKSRNGILEALVTLLRQC